MRAVVVEIAAGIDVEGENVARRRPTRGSSDRAADVTAHEIEGLERELVTLTRQLGRELIPEAAYRMSRAAIKAEIDALSAWHAREVLTVEEFDAAPNAAQLLVDWDGDLLLTSELREVLRSLIDVVEVRPGRPRAEITVTPKWRRATR